MSSLKVASINNPSAPSGGLAISTAGLVTGAGLDLIVSQSFSAVSSVSIDGCFTSTYDNYYLSYNCTNSLGTTQAVNLRLRAASSDDTSSNYAYQMLEGSATTASAARTTGTTSLYVGVTTATDCWSCVTLFRPAIAQPTFYITTFGVTIATPVVRQYSGAHNVSTAYDGFTVYPASGTITGTLRVYGYRN